MKLIHRTRILLSLLQEMGGQLSASRMQQLLFLYCREFVKRDEYYDFIRLENGPCSVQAEEDKHSLIHKKLLEKSNDWIMAPAKNRFATELDFFEKIALQDLKNQWLHQSSEALAEYIASHYPAATSRSESDDIIFYTIGYEGLSPEAYANLLCEHKIRLLADVRRNAFSQKFGFSKSELKNLLTQVGIAYLHMPELGIESEKRQSLATDSDYENLFKEYEQTTLASQQAKLTELQQLLEKNKRIAITCFEADPHHCHRSRVAKALKSYPNFTYKIEHLQLCKHPAKAVAHLL